MTRKEMKKLKRMNKKISTDAINGELGKQLLKQKKTIEIYFIVILLESCYIAYKVLI